MKLRNQLLLVFVTTWILVFAIAWGFLHFYLLNQYIDLEKKSVLVNLNRVDEALAAENKNLFALATDWSHWDDLYQFTQGNNPEFAAKNLKLDTFVDSNINLLTYWNQKGELLVGSAVDPVRESLTTFPAGLQQYTQTVLKHPNGQFSVKGFALLNNKIMLIAASNISDGTNHERSSGVTIIGRFITPKIISQLGQTTNLNLDLFPLNEIQQSPFLTQVLATMEAQHESHYLYYESANELKAFSLIHDINGQTIGLVRAIFPRIIYQTGLQAKHYFLAAFLAMALLFSTLVILLLKKLVIRRLEVLEQDISNFSLTGSLSHRVKVTGNDELSTVEAEINSMLSRLNDSHSHLEKRIYERTQALEKSNAQLQQEISERRSVEKELVISKEHLVKLAHYDSLTGLPNRIFFNELLNKALVHAAHAHKLLGILFIDLDGFKVVNDEAGHATGDMVLRETAKRFAAVLRAGDILSRLGGDEFIILLNDIAHPKFASSVAEKLLQTCQQPIRVHNRDFYLSASIGICIFPNDGVALQELQRNADVAMYQAKRSGGGVFQYFTKDMNAAAHEHVQLETALRKAVANKSFSLFYQPKLNLADGVVVGVEALIRWNDPVLGAVEPGKFIPLAEETGLIIPIGEWALFEACRANKRWQDQGFDPISISVNLSAKQFRYHDIAQLVKTALDESGLEAKYLELEITETSMLDDVKVALSRLHEIHHLGVKISIDDFGTGYTSISYLKEYPIHILKIDQSFIKGIPHNSNDLAIINAIITLAHNLGLLVVAEGVENEVQMHYLADAQCDMIQGYYFCRPLPENKVILHLHRIESVV